MSADNYIGVLEQNGKWGLIPYGNMSMLGEDCKYRGEVTQWFDTREAALVAAHDEYKQASIVEYGVIEVDPIPADPCGKCFVCIHERNVVSMHVPRCYVCNEPITTTDWYELNEKGQRHVGCKEVA